MTVLFISTKELRKKEMSKTVFSVLGLRLFSFYQWLL